jgi:hypothetical protein
MPYLQRLKARPDPDKLTRREVNQLARRFDPYSGEVLIEGEPIPWDKIEEIEVAKAARAEGPAGWLVKLFVYSGADRYHVAFRYGYHEAVLINLSLQAAQYVVQSAAFYAPGPIRFTGPEGLSPLTEA